MLLLLTMVIGAVPVYAAEGDTPSAWAKEFVEDAIEKGYVPAHLQGKYQSPITREEFAELFVTAVFAEVNDDYEKEDSITKKYVGFDKLTVDVFLDKVSTTESFTDTSNKYVKVANILGMVNGVGDGKFNPDGLITREQAAIMFVNYLQTVYLPGGGHAEVELDDIDSASSWARDAVIWAYGAGFINGTKAFKAETVIGQKDPKILQIGHFDTKGNFTREQAVTVISKLGLGDHLDNLILRGYMLIGLEALDNWEIDGDTLYYKSTGYDYRYSGIKEFFRTQTKLKNYAEEYTSEQIIAALLSPNGAQNNMMDTYHLNRVLSGEETLYDYEVFTIAHNVDDSLVVISKNPGYGYFSYGSVLAYRVDGERRVATAVEVK